jgi:hypothetical protein
MKASHFDIGKTSYDHAVQSYTAITPIKATAPVNDAKFSVEDAKKRLGKASWILG